MWQKGCALLVGLVAVLGIGWVSAQEPGAGYYSGGSYVLKAGDFVSWPSGHGWYFRMTSTSNYPFKVATTNSSGRAIFAKAPSTGYAVYADGRIAAKSLKYTTRRTHHLTVGSAAFDTTMDTYTFEKCYDTGGGAWLTSAGGALVAAVNLPDGAVITGLKAFFYDNSASSLTAYLYREPLSGSYEQMASVSSTGSSGYTNSQTTTIAHPVVDNLHYAYEVDAYAADWYAPNLKIKGVIITYTIGEAS